MGRTYSSPEIWRVRAGPRILDRFVSKREERWREGVGWGRTGSERRVLERALLGRVGGEVACLESREALVGLLSVAGSLSLVWIEGPYLLVLKGALV